MMYVYSNVVTSGKAISQKNKHIIDDNHDTLHSLKKSAFWLKTSYFMNNNSQAATNLPVVLFGTQSSKVRATTFYLFGHTLADLSLDILLENLNNHYSGFRNTLSV